jgi:hypothetical protein
VVARGDGDDLAAGFLVGPRPAHMQEQPAGLRRQVRHPQGGPLAETEAAIEAGRAPSTRAVYASPGGDPGEVGVGEPDGHQG